MRDFDVEKFRQVSIHSGEPVYNTVDSLSAFWPGLQVLAGDIENAIKSHLICESRFPAVNCISLLAPRLESVEETLWATRGVGYQPWASRCFAISIETG